MKIQYGNTSRFTNKLSDGMLSTAALPAKKPRASGLYGTIPIPSSLNACKAFYDKDKGMTLRLIESNLYEA
jgi:hypothetical protein